MLLSLFDITKVQNIFDICKHLSKNLHLLSLIYVNGIITKIEQFCSINEQNLSNLFQLQTDTYRHRKSYISDQSPTQLRDLPVSGKFAPLRMLGWASASGHRIITNFLSKSGALPRQPFINH